MTLPAVVILATFALLCLLAWLDYKRICRRTGQRFETPDRAFDYRRALHVRDRTRRGPEAEAHLGKSKLGERS